MPTLSSVVVAWLISNAPNLEDIGLHELYIKPNVANAMIKLKHLSKLYINQGYKDDDDDDEGMIQFLEYHIGMGNGSTLEEITIATSTLKAETTWIPLIARLQCLKKLELLALSIHNDCLPAMETISQGCQALEDLTLGWRTGCHDFGLGVISSFSQHSNLKYLTIGSSRTVDPSDLVIMVTFPSLERLYLHCDVPTNIMNVLRKHISKIAINKV